MWISPRKAIEISEQVEQADIKAISTKLHVDNVTH